MDCGNFTDPAFIKEKVRTYEHFIARTLQPQVETINRLIADFEKEASQYRKFKEIAVKIMHNTDVYRTEVDIGEQRPVEAVSDQPPSESGVNIHVGLGFFVEVPWSEALVTAEKRVQIIESKSKLARVSLGIVQKDIDEANESVKQLRMLATGGLVNSKMKGSY